MLEDIVSEAIKKRQEGHLDESLILFNHALEVLPTNADILSERAVTYIHLNKLSLAMLDMDYCISLQPTNPYHYSCRAYLKSTMNDVDGAILDYEAAIELDPQDITAINNMGLLEEKAGNLEKAKQIFERADNTAGIDFEKHLENVVKQNSMHAFKSNTVAERKSLINTILSVFTDKRIFLEFVQFLKNGLKK